MRANFKKRALAYTIDIIILSLILIGINIITYKENKDINVKLDVLNETYLNQEITFDEYLKEYSTVSYEIDKDNIIYTVVNIIFVVIYFIIIPFIFNGKTIGNKIMKIRLVKEDRLTIISLIIRNLIINGLGYMLLSLVLIHILKPYSYFIITTILSIIQLTLIIIILIGLIKNNNNLILHDRLSKTKVICE